MGTVQGYEVFIPKVLKAGAVQKFPGGFTVENGIKKKLPDKVNTIEEDIEIYPHGAETDFGKRAWACASLPHAEFKFNELMQRGAPVLDEAGEEKPAPKPGAVELTKIPDGEFSCNELAATNDVEYPIASVWLKAQVASGAIVKSRKERRASRGPETQLYKKSC